MGFFNVIGLISAATIGLIGFLDTNLPSHKPGRVNSSVRIAVALNGDKGEPGALRHAGGTAPLVNAFNENQNYCGSTYYKAHTIITSGSFIDMVIWQEKIGPGEQATSLQIIPTTNELCIAYISQTWADDTPRGWVGDMGHGCYRDWYYSNIIVGNDHKPKCTWIDKDHSHGISTAALQIHMQDFTNLTVDYNTDPSFYCEHPTMLFKADTHDYHWKNNKHYFKTPKKIKFWDNSDPSPSNDFENDAVQAKGHSRRSTRLARRSGLAAFSHLIASRHDKHSARELCESEHSHGPDFLSLSEGIFCDMDTKTHWPLCDGNETTTSGTGVGVEGCYHWDTHSLVLGGDWMARHYSHVVEWD